MKRGTKALLLFSSVMVIGGVGFYLYQRYAGKRKIIGGDGGDGKGSNDNKPPVTPPSPTVVSTGTNPNLSFSDILEFQGYAKKLGAYLGSSGSNKDGVDGMWGSLSQSAWDKYGQQWLKSKQPPVPAPDGSNNQVVAPQKSTDWNLLKTRLSDWYFKTFYNNKTQLSTSSWADTTSNRILIDFLPDGKGEFMVWTSKGITQGSKKPFEWYFIFPNLYIVQGGKIYTIPENDKSYNDIWNMLKASGYWSGFDGADGGQEATQKKKQTIIIDASETYFTKVKI